MKYIVIASHRPEPGAVLRAVAGDELACAPRETVYEGWLWCTNSEGVQAWVPAAYLSAEGPVYRLNRDYVSRELAVDVGDRVELLEIESAWAWVAADDGDRGWVPLVCLQRDDPA